MIARTSVRWRLVAWVTGVLLAVAAVIFVVVYEQTGTELRAEIDQDVAGDLSQLSQAVKGIRTRPAGSPEALLAQVGVYLRAQPFSATSSLMFAAIPGHGSTSNPPELLGSPAPDDGETAGPAEPGERAGTCAAHRADQDHDAARPGHRTGPARRAGRPRQGRRGPGGRRRAAGDRHAGPAQHRALVRHRRGAGARPGPDRLLRRRRVGLPAAAADGPRGGAGR